MATVFQRGEHAGCEWAIHEDDRDAIARVVAMAPDMFVSEDNAHSLAELVFMAIVGEDNFDRVAASEFWESVCPTDEGETMDEEFVRGFLAGARPALPYPF